MTDSPETGLPGLSRRTFVASSGLALASFAILSDGAEAAASLYLVKNGRTDATVHIPTSTDAQVEYAAQELVRVVAKATGLTLPIVRGDAPANARGTRVYIGFAGRGSDPRVPSLLNGLDPDGFVIAPSGATITIVGPTSWGTRFGVMEVLETRADARWLMPTEIGEDVPATKTVSFAPTTIRQSPTFTSRALYPADEQVEVTWEPQPEPDVWGDRNRSHWRINFHHALYDMFDSAKFGESHPEWYPIINGTRYIPPSGVNVNWQPRLRAPGVVEEAARQAIAYFDDFPQAGSFSLGVTDGGGFSDEELAGLGPNSIGLTDMSPVYYEFVNKVTSRVMDARPEFRNRYIGLLAYAFVNDPPPFPLHPNVVPYLTRDRYGWVDPEYKAADQQHTFNWLKVARQVAFYDYVYGNPYAVPRVPFAQIEETIDWAAEHGVIGQMSEMVFNWGEGAKNWSYARKLVNADLSMRNLNREWYQRAVGPAAAGPLDAYFQMWEAIWMTRIPQTMFFRAGKGLTYFPFDDFSYLGAVTDADIARAKSLLARARTKTRTDHQRARLAVIEKEFAYSEASALSYPREFPDPTTQAQARALLEKVLTRLDASVAFAHQRDTIDADLRASGPPHNVRGLSFRDCGAVWSGWNCKVMLQVADFLKAHPADTTSLRRRITDVSTGTSEAAAYCAHLLLMADNLGTSYGSNTSFESGDLTAWSITPNQPPASPATVTTDLAVDGTRSLRLPGGFVTCGVNQTQNVFPAGEGVWVTRFRYRVPEGSDTRGVLVPGILAKGRDGAVLGYQQDHYWPISEGAGDWVECIWVDKLPQGTHQVQPVLVSAYQSGTTVVHLDHFEFAYFGELSTVPDPEGTVVREEDVLSIYPPDSTLQPDSLAGNGSAIRLVGDKITWAAQLPWTQLPPEGRWRIKVRLRIEAKPGAVPEGDVVQVGVYPNGPLVDYPATMFADKAYHSITVEGDYAAAENRAYAYVTGGLSQDVAWVWVDRFELVPV